MLYGANHSQLPQHSPTNFNNLHMYASSVDYKKLYSTEYFGKSPGTSSFPPDIFSNELISFCKGNGIKHVLDVGSGSGALAHQLRSGGLSVLTCDFEPVSDESVHFDLAGSQEAAVDIRRLMHKRTNGDPWLVTCLDVLEHMDIEHVYSATSNLYTLSCGLLLASISTRPSSRDNRFHTSIVPMSTWISILSLVGLKLEDDRIFRDARTVRKEFPAASGFKLVAHWAQADPFNDIDDGEPSYLLLSASQGRPVLDAAEQCEKLLDVAFRHEKRLQFSAFNSQSIALNLHHPQDFILFRPILDVIPAGCVIALIRISLFATDELSLMRGFFARSGLRCIEYQRAEELIWTDIGADILLSGGESSVAPSHILSRQIVESANLSGVRTLQLQHGIWAEAFHQRIPTFGSGEIISWGNQYEKFFQDGTYELAGTVLQNHPDDITRYHHAGGAKFTDSTLAQFQNIVKSRLGVRTERYRQLVLLGTNLRWGKHSQSAENVRARLAKAMRAVPDTFFVVKLHPSERTSEAADMRLPNSLVLDDITLGCMDLQIGRLIPSFDMVVSSLSTLLLDAAVAGKPCIQYDTGNSYSYQGLEAVPIERLPYLLTRPSKEIKVNTALIQHYADSAHCPFYTELAKILNLPTKRAPSKLSAATFYSVAITLEDQLDEAYRNKRAIEFSQQETQRLLDQQLILQSKLFRAEEELVKSQAAMHAAAASSEVAQARTIELSKTVGIYEERAAAATQTAAFEKESRQAMLKSRSWVLTAPLRALRDFLNR